MRPSRIVPLLVAALLVLVGGSGLAEVVAPGVARAVAASAPSPPAAVPVPTAQDAPVGTPDVVVLGVAGLRWSDVGPHTPTLAALAERGAVGVLSVKARPAVSCPADGWLTLGAGARAEAFREADAEEDDGCPLSLAPLDEQVRRNAATPDGAVVGALRDALPVPLTAFGGGARLALGLPPLRAIPAPPPLRDGVRVVELGAVPSDDTAGAGARQVDALLAAELAALPASTDVLVVGLSETQRDEGARLHLAIGAGPSFPHGALRSASTRRAPYVQLVDVAPTVLDLLDQDVPEEMDGQPWQVVPDAPTVEQLVDLEVRALAGKRATVPFYVVVVAALLVLLAVLWTRPAAARVVALAATAAPGASYVAQLVPWWRSPLPLLTLLGVVAVLSVAVAVAAARTGRSVAAVCGLTAAVLVVDLLAGAPLQMDAVAGYSPLVAGRFAGLGNVAFGVYGTSFLLLAASLAAGRLPGRAARVVAALGAVAVVVVGAPGWGSDVGGVLALLPAFVVLGLLVTGAPVSLVRLLLAGLAAALVVGAFALLDLARPAGERTHLGRFAAELADGTAGDLLERKASAVFGLLFSSPVTAALPLVVVAAVWLVLRPPPPLRRAFDDEPALRHGLVAVGVLSLVGFLVNDSGAAVPALAVLVAAPATIAVVLAPRRPAAGVAHAEKERASL